MELRQNVLAEFPHLIAAPYRLMVVEKNSVNNVYRIFDVAEASLKYYGAAVACELAQQGRIGGIVDWVKKPMSLGVLHGWIRDTLRGAKSADANGFIAHLQNFYLKENVLHALDGIVNARNRTRGHGVTLDEHSAGPLQAELNSKLNEFILETAPMNVFRPVIVKGMGNIKDQEYDHQVQFATGDNPLFRVGSLKLDRALPFGQVFLVHGEAALLSLYPFILYEECAKCGEHHLFVFSCIREKRTDYLNPLKGCAHQLNLSAEEFLGKVYQPGAKAFKVPGGPAPAAPKDSAPHPTPGPGLRPAPGYRMSRKLLGNKETIHGIAWSPDGKHIATGTEDGMVRIYEVPTGSMIKQLKNHTNRVTCVAWSPDGLSLASGSADDTVTIWDAAAWKPRTSLGGFYNNNITCMAWAPGGGKFAFGSQDNRVWVWNTRTWKMDIAIEAHGAWVTSIAWNREGLLASASLDGTLKIWNGANGELVSTLKGLNEFILSLLWTADGTRIISSSSNHSISVWDVPTSRLIQKLEGHTGKITSISLSGDERFLASKSQDGTVRIWRTDCWETAARIPEPMDSSWHLPIAFHPLEPLLATLDAGDGNVRIWRLEPMDLLAREVGKDSVHYTNAKVVLVGDTGVGKTGLGYRLARNIWVPTESTHGMNVWLLSSAGDREVILWDFAGQAEYRLIHQLFLNETSVALIVYDPSKSGETIAGVDYWEKALAKTLGTSFKKILVAARHDVGGVQMTREDVEEYCRDRGFAGHYTTSAKSNEGCQELKEALLKAIPWDELPKISSPLIFKQIKDFIYHAKQGDRLLIREQDLKSEFFAKGGTVVSDEEYRTVIGHAENAGIIKKLSFGDFILLKPEVLNSFASSIIDAARTHADGLGCVRKTDALNGRVPLKYDHPITFSDRIFLFHATVELFMKLGLALEQDQNLVFPSKFNQRRARKDEDGHYDTEFLFKGPVENIYSTLIVKLYYSQVFKIRSIWRNAAEFELNPGQVFGIRLTTHGDGEGLLRVYYSPEVDGYNKMLFQKIIALHFQEKQVDAMRQRVIRCQNPECGRVVQDQEAIHLALKKGREQIPCLYCYEMIPLADQAESAYKDAELFRDNLLKIDCTTKREISHTAGFISAQAELKTPNFRDWAGGSDTANLAIVYTDIVDGLSLNIAAGDEEWNSIRENHFALSRRLVDTRRGYWVKTMGDSTMSTFHSASDALDYCMELLESPGHAKVKVRAGVHLGPVKVGESEAFGQQISLATKIVSKAKADGIIATERVKEEIDILRSPRYVNRPWQCLSDQVIEGFPGTYNLWLLQGR